MRHLIYKQFLQFTNSCSILAPSKRSPLSSSCIHLSRQPASSEHHGIRHKSVGPLRTDCFGTMLVACYKKLTYDPTKIRIKGRKKCFPRKWLPKEECWTYLTPQLCLKSRVRRRRKRRKLCDGCTLGCNCETKTYWSDNLAQSFYAAHATCLIHTRLKQLLLLLIVWLWCLHCYVFDIQLLYPGWVQGNGASYVARVASPQWIGKLVDWLQLCTITTGFWCTITTCLPQKPYNGLVK